MGYRIITEDREQIMTSKTYAGCETYRNAHGGTNRNGKRLYIEECQYYEYDDNGNEFYTDENGKRHYTRMEG